VCTIAHQIPPAAGRPWGLPLPVRLLLVLTHLPTNLTTRALAALLSTSQSTVDRIIDHLVPVLATLLRLDANSAGQPWIIDATPIPVHDQSITAISNNYRRSVNTQIVIGAQRRTLITVGRCWPATATTSSWPATPSPICSTAPGQSWATADTAASPRSPVHAQQPTARIIHDDHYRKRRRIRARVEHVIARLKDRQILRQCRRRGQAINHSLHIVAGLWNLKTRGQLRVNS
jgi:hypothetical protein